MRLINFHHKAQVLQSLQEMPAVIRKRTPLRTLFPFASAAIRSARFVMLFDPGTETSTGIMSAFLPHKYPVRS